MKRKLTAFLSILVMSAFVLAFGCSLPNAPTSGGKPGLTIALGMNPVARLARTFSPEFTDPYLSMFSKIVLSVDSTPDSGGTFHQDFSYDDLPIVDVPYGAYTISVKAYLNASDDSGNYAAFGSVQYTYSQTNRYVLIVMSPIADNGTGILAYTLADTAGIIDSATLIRYDDIDNYPDITGDPDGLYPYSLSADGNSHDLTLPAGYYALFFGNNIPSVVQIYKNFNTVAVITIDTNGTIAAPTVDTAEGVIEPNTPVTLSCETDGADIYYTTDGSVPSTSSALYSDPIVITASPTTIQAFAVKAGMADSELMSVTYLFKVAAPLASPDASANPVAVGAPVTLSCETDGAVIYYTIDGSTPATSSAVYSDPIVITANPTTIQAIAVKDGMADSDVMSETYQFAAVATPSASPQGTELPYGSTVTLSCDTENALIYYTTGASADPAVSGTLYSGPITLKTSPLTIQAIAIKDGMVPSAEMSETYTLKAPAPTASPASGNVSLGTGVALSCVVDNAAIYYTTDGSTPSASSALYAVPIVINAGSTTVKAIAVAAGMTDSDVMTETYQVAAVAAPEVSLASGEVAYGSPVTLSCTTSGAAIYYTTDGTAPTSASAQYSAPITLTASPLTIRAIALKTGMIQSAELAVTYTLITAAPTASPASGTVAYGTTVTLSCDVVGAAIYYTTDGSVPSQLSTLYTGAIAITAPATIQAIAVAAGMTGSDVMSASYNLLKRTVTFNANYLDGITVTSKVSDGSTVGAAMPSDPSRGDYVFTGWNTAQDGSGTSFNGNTVVLGDITVYAQWRDKTPEEQASDLAGMLGAASVDNGTVTLGAPATLESAITIPDGVTLVTGANGLTLAAGASVTVGQGGALVISENGSVSGDGNITVSAGGKVGYTATAQGDFSNLTGDGNLLFYAGSTFAITEGAYTYTYLGSTDAASFELTDGTISVSGAAYPTFTLKGNAVVGTSAGAPGGGGGAAILANHTFVVDSGSTLTVPAGLTLLVSGTLTGDGAIAVNGSIIGAGNWPGKL